MGYDLHITRAEFWAENDDAPISEQEWREVVEGDDDLLFVPEDGPNTAIWTAHPIEDDAWLDWQAGEIFTKNPDEPLIEKMIEIAGRLGAMVQGDDGETYPLAEDAAPREDFWGKRSGRIALLSVACGVALCFAGILIDDLTRSDNPNTPRSQSETLLVLAFGFSATIAWIGGTIVALLTLSVQASGRAWAWAAVALSGAFFAYLSLT